ncbi:MAG: 1-acyl-sn-glycerol-3-phosphate acyltransferase [Bacteroidota bacterium]
MKYFWKLFLASKGWNTEVQYPYHHLKKCVIIVAPHTSNWDFIIGLGYRSLVGLGAARFLGKKELFRPPLGFIFRWIGGTPVDRKSSHDLVDQVATIFKNRDRFVLALAPEGTRSRVEKLRTGFYFIARAANVPIVMVGLDWRYKTLRFSEPLYPTNQEKDFATIHNFFRPIEGKHPGQGLEHL